MILSRDFPEHTWPLSGGWGYHQHDAAIIGLDSDALGVGFEHRFIEHRTYEELIVSRPEDEQYVDIRIIPLMQSLVPGEDRKLYDRLQVKVTALRKADLEAL